MWARTSLTQRVMALVVFGLLLLLAAFAFISTWALRESVQRSLQERLLLAQVAAQSIDHYNRSLLAQIQEVASSKSIDLVRRDLEQETRMLESLKSKLSARELFLLDKNGTVLSIQPQANDAISENLSDNRYVASAYFAGQPRISWIVPSLIDGSPVVVYLVPILGADGTVLGAIGAGIDLTQPKISGYIEAITLGRTGYAQVVDEKGEVLASTQPQDVFGQSDHGARFVALIQDKKAVVRTCHNCHESAAGVSRRKDVLAFAPLSTASWGVAVRQAEEEALRPAQTLKLGMLGVGIGSLLPILALTAIFMRGLLSPIHRLTDAARRIAAGDLTGPIEAKGEDEIAVLARSFETMRTKLEISRQQIEDRAKDIEQRNLELSALNAIATTTSQSLDLEQSLDAALDKVLAAIGSEAGGIFLAGAEGQPMVLKIQRGLSQNQVEFIAQWQQPATLPQHVQPITQEPRPPSARNGRPVSITSVPLS
ncbi:MAG: cache domain-containing protein, partial [Chloroflexota bacterium]